ncbi:MAG: aminotransferase class I/II-fold pyridoxal phosphate-dependent enzyme [Gemmatimonadetes bacterium]|uniref:Aminotransferase class I/II-fold pyridoxal phosphate-dependent enzyme n=1 Tax=Candidatus Kutchimonas denitrificans TaxID=3056748 RepID=A0AAE4Z7H2_9BACT|nr:aminotransferase class I/II-fold pyridoxal phosphate-dependent enzyme [Gemmatimonadota bacterium]NIR74112.1 aminotransferase class I/II-fold pyridoxal phosphate-dependent enzyme [Candidatus Kutchimonas denitrificans]NIS01294.1 aminotransferase class I/II-fold pyridoxal phosphate-dependent enzyme [Gemmatimonadota bacterium]NIT67025.1 aminotransferase class I/II-fold pyridoxal phosphate-dependent enzyme [Gemmatimonadota bacterium]NIU51685.1 aminotransferase class I/II-fold pyridoxal phosphate-
MRELERISTKLAKFRPSLTLELKSLAAEREERGLPVYDFGLGETKGELAPHIREAGIRAYREGQTMYGDPAGLIELRRSVLEWLGLQDRYGPENVVITAGAKQSLLNIFLSVCNPADTVLFDAAPWVSYQPLAIAAYASPIMVLPRAGELNRLKVSPADLKRNLKMRPHARLFLLNSPVNPTGQLYSADEVEALLQVCVEHGIFFVLDRLYWRIVFEGRTYPEPRVDDETRPWLIQVDGISKNFRRTGGLRIGWSVAPVDVTRAMVNLQSHYTSGPAVPTQYSALAAITEPYDEELCRALQGKRDLLRKEAEALAYVEVWPTPASFYSFWDVRGVFGKRAPDGRLLESSSDVAEYLVQAAGVVTGPGTAFMQDGYLRVSFATPDDQIVAGVRAAATALEQLS